MGNNKKQAKQVFCFDCDGVLVNSQDIFYNAYINTVNYIDKKGFETFIRSRQNGQKILPGRLVNYAKYFLNSDLYEEVISMLEVLKDNKKIVVIISSNNSKTIVEIMKHNKIEGLFDAIYGSDYKYEKPDNNLWNDIIKRFSVSKEQIIYIGDESIDYDFANKGDIDFIPVKYGMGNESFIESINEPSINTPSDLYKYILSLIK